MVLTDFAQYLKMPFTRTLKSIVTLGSNFTFCAGISGFRGSVGM